MADVLAAWDAKLEEVSDLPGPLGQILGYPADTARFPLADLQVIDLDAADPLRSMVRLFPQ